MVTPAGGKISGSATAIVVKYRLNLLGFQLGITNPLSCDAVMSNNHAKVALSRRDFLVFSGGCAALAGLGAPALAEAQSSLHYQVNAYIQSLRRSGRIPRDERTAWSVYDFTTGTKLVAINEERPLQAASMLKPFVAQAYFYRHIADRQGFPYTNGVRQRMTAMIRDSCNSETNYFITRAGGSPGGLQRLLQQRAGGVFQQTRIVEYIPQSGRTYRNQASARDYSRYLFATWNERMPMSKEVLHYMGLPNGNRIVRGATGIPSGTKLYHKTGSTARLCGDMGIVVAQGRNGRPYPYTFIGIIDKSQRTNQYTSWIRDRGNVLREVSSLVYAFMKQRHNLV